MPVCLYVWSLDGVDDLFHDDNDHYYHNVEDETSQFLRTDWSAIEGIAVLTLEKLLFNK